jgi:hypothetical protein
MNLGNYGLGPRGCIALAVALVVSFHFFLKIILCIHIQRNTTVLSLNLSGNNIGNKGMSHVYQILTENTYIEDYVRRMMCFLQTLKESMT